MMERGRGAVAGLTFFGAAVVALALSAMAWSPVGVQAAGGQAAVDAGTVDFYTSQVEPIFKTNCFRCHGGLSHRGGLQMTTKSGMMKGGHDGVVIVAGHPEDSLLVKLMRHEGPANDPMPMPPHKDKVSDADIATVEQWVKAGAVMPDDGKKP